MLRSLYLALAYVGSVFVMADTLSYADVVSQEGGWPKPVPSHEAWKSLPPSDGDRTDPLPIWARMIVTEMPRTTAAFLELDRAHRTLGAVATDLRAACRFVAAKANGCEYTMATARLDTRAANTSAEKLASLEDDSWQAWTSEERLALEFAKRMATDSDGIPDAMFSELVSKFGDRAAACMVLHSAYANFQDRFLLCLRIPTESIDVLPPIVSRFDPAGLVSTTTPPPNVNAKSENSSPEPSQSLLQSKHSEAGVAELTWLPYSELQTRLTQQRRRATRLRIPEWDSIAPNLPTGLMEKPSDIIWYRIVFGYASELAVPFEMYMRTAGSEVSKNWDRIFGNSIFWIVTDAMKCPYCMGHCEMNWEVAGLDASAIAERSHALAGSDWSTFSVAEQRALSFATKLTKTPSQIDFKDIQGLREGFGDQRALFIMLNASRYNYMTRISNGFQLTLESKNVFWDYYKITPKGK